MPVERKPDGSVTIRTENGVTAIGRVITTYVNREEENFQRWVDECAEKVTACAHTIKETEEYFLKICDVLPIPADDRRMKSFLENVIMNHFKEKLEYKHSEFSFDMTDEEMEKWHKEQEGLRREVRRISPEQFGLKLRGYYLPQNERNAVYYEEARKKHEEMKLLIEKRRTERGMCCTAREAEMPLEDICFFFEEVTEHCQSSGGGDTLMKQLIIFRGVMQEDIDKRTPRFLGYISALRELGKLPGVQ